jgi:hypothetical protein
MDARPVGQTPVMGLALVVVTAAQLLDLGTFVRMVGVHGPAAEANPFVAGLLFGHGVLFVAVAKIAALALIVAIIVVLAGRDAGVRLRHPRLVVAVAFAAIVAGLVGGWTNAGAILGGAGLAGGIPL